MLDTSTVIMLPRIDDPAALPAEPLITTVTLAELAVGPLVTSTDKERAARQSEVRQAEADFDPMPFDVAAARAFARVAASLRKAGRKPAARAYDAMIAATALANGLSVYTCNRTTTVVGAVRDSSMDNGSGPPQASSSRTRPAVPSPRTD